MVRNHSCPRNARRPWDTDPSGFFLKHVRQGNPIDRPAASSVQWNIADDEICSIGRTICS
jgi:hypothetical protein